MCVVTFLCMGLGYKYMNWCIIKEGGAIGNEAKTMIINLPFFHVVKFERTFFLTSFANGMW